MDDLSHYEVKIDLGNINTSHALVADLVGPGKRVLDIGCWTGDLGRALQTWGCQVSGLEIDPAAAEKARIDLDEVIVADLNTHPASEHFGAGSFDAVVLADVLEHLTDPVAVLVDAQKLLAPEGRIVISIPNVTHGSVRLALLQGRWNYTATGLLDVTHIRFFNRRLLLEMFHAAGMVVEDLRASLADPLSVEVVVDADRLPDSVVEWVRHQRDALVYQFIAAARPAAGGEASVAPPMMPAVPEENVRAIDKHTERSEAELARRHEQLTVRDHIIGLEAATATAETRAAIAERDLRRAIKRLEVKNERIAALRNQLAQVRQERDGQSNLPTGVAGTRVGGALEKLRPGRPRPS